jgi:hypothetical protein
MALGLRAQPNRHNGQPLNLVLCIKTMNSWTNQIYIATFMILGLAGFHLLLAERNAPKEHVAMLTNTSAELFALQRLSVQTLNSGKEVRDLHRNCRRVDAHSPDWEYAPKLSSGQSDRFIWDGMVAGCEVAPVGKYQLVAIDYGPELDYRNPRKLFATLIQK